MWNDTKTVVSKTFIVLNIYIRKKVSHYLSFHFKKLNSEGNKKISRRKNAIENRTEINKMEKEKKESERKINETKRSFFEKNQ